eukprot:3029488-Rhodomonas_salina.1
MADSAAAASNLTPNAIQILKSKARARNCQWIPGPSPEPVVPGTSPSPSTQLRTLLSAYARGMGCPVLMAAYIGGAVTRVPNWAARGCTCAGLRPFLFLAAVPFGAMMLR